MSGYEAKSSGISLTSLDWSLWSMVFECVLVAGYHLSQLGLKGVPYNLNTIPASQGCFYPNTYHRGYFTFCASVHALIVLKHITSTLCNLWRFQAVRTSEMSKWGYFGVLVHSKPSQEGYYASVHVFSAQSTLEAHRVKKSKFSIGWVLSLKPCEYTWNTHVSHVATV